MNEDKVYKAGDIEIRDLILTNFVGKKLNLKKSLMQMDICEDLFSSSVSGTLRITDTNNMIEDFPIIGEETLEITYRTSADFKYVTRKFEVYGLTNKESLGDKSYVATLNFCSEEFLTNRSVLVSRSFANMTPSDIAKSVLKNIIRTKKPILVEDTIGVNTYVAPSIYPFEVIAAMTKRARSSVNVNGGAYMFFENNNGFNFVSLEKLFKQKPIEYRMGFRDSYASNLDSMYTITALNQRSQVSMLDAMSSGALGVNAKVLNLQTKELQDVSFDYFNDNQYKKINRINGVNPSLRLTTSKFKHKTKDGLYKFMVSSPSDFVSYKESNVSVRYSQISSLVNGPKVDIEVPFNSELGVGDILKLVIPTMYSSDSELEIAKEDRFISGNYIALCVRHIITPQYAVTAVECGRDTYTSNHEAYVKQNNERLGI